MQAIYDVPAPAKLNLFLHITGRRADGYHLLQSVFMLIDWCDTLHFEMRSDTHISREDLGPPLPENDLIRRAAQALQAATGCNKGAHIAVTKRIPTQAGMGGGSSDAASTLLALNRLWNLKLSLSALEKIGLQLGADIPFFLRGRNAWVEGVGEAIFPLEGDNALRPESFVVVKPEAGLDTKTIFSSEKLKRDTERTTISSFTAEQYDFGHNDLQPVAQSLCSDVGKAVTWLASKNLKARMTGSGSAVFAQLMHDINAQSVPSNWQIRLCKNIDVHPLLGWASG